MVERVPLAHVALALLVTIIWGVAFVATRLALDDFSPAARAANTMVKSAWVCTTIAASPGGIPAAMPKNWNRNWPV